MVNSPDVKRVPVPQLTEMSAQPVDDGISVVNSTDVKRFPVPQLTEMSAQPVDEGLLSIFHSLLMYLCLHTRLDPLI